MPTKLPRRPMARWSKNWRGRPAMKLICPSIKCSIVKAQARNFISGNSKIYIFCKRQHSISYTVQCLRKFDEILIDCLAELGTWQFFSFGITAKRQRRVRASWMSKIQQNVKVLSKFSSRYKYSHNEVNNNILAWKHGHSVAAVVGCAQLCCL